MSYGQMTAGSWIYIGTQGILQGTYETFAGGRAAALRRQPQGPAGAHRGPRRHGGAQPLAATMNEGVMIAVEVDERRIARRLETRYLDLFAPSVDEALARAREALEGGALSRSACSATPADVLPSS